MLHLTSLTVLGLLGRFKHEIEFPHSWEFAILHGPNGVGKTKLLELVDAVGSNRLVSVLDMPFDSAEFAFSEGSTLVLDRVLSAANDEDQRRLHITLRRASGDETQFVLDRSQLAISPGHLRMLEREVPLERLESDLWYDHAQDDYIDRAGILSRYPRFEPSGRPSTPFTPPEPYAEFLTDFNVHLIETQRLITLTPVPPPHRRRARRPQQSTVLRYAEDLTRRLREALAENSRTSQQLDRTFPRRVLDRPAPPEATQDRIQERYARQTELREQLAEIAVLDAFAPLPLPTRDLDDWERRMLWTYLEDAEQKLATFTELLARVQLLRRIVNSRFLFNELVIDRERGFKFETDSGEEIGADALSSGEQHELVLAYDLLFNVDPETTVLIDEPELSLHITWQQKFLDDVVEISQLANLRFLVATHSPQIIHKWWDRTIPLYDERPVREDRSL